MLIRSVKHVDFGDRFLGGTVLLVFGTVRYILISVFPYWQMLMADWQMIMAGAARSVVRYALCPLATPAQIKGDGGDFAFAVQKGSGRDRVNRARWGK